MVSIRARLLALLLPALILVVLVVAASGYLAASQRISAFLDADLAESARVLLLWTLAEPRAGDEPDAANIRRELDELFRGVEQHEGRQGNDDVDEDRRSRGEQPMHPPDAAGQRMASIPLLDYVITRPGLIDEVVSNTALGALPACATPGYSRATARDGGQWFVYTASGGDPPATVCVGQRSEDRRAIVISMLLPSLRWWLLVLPLAAAVVWIGVRRGLSPLNTVTQDLQQRSSGDLAPLPGEPPEEVKPLFDALNGLLGRQRELIEQERRFSAEAAHELRTPLTTVRLRAERALHQQQAASVAAANTLSPTSDVPTERPTPRTEAPDDTSAQALRSIIEETARAERVLAQLLALARIDAADAGGVTLEPLALLPLLREVLAEQADIALARKIDLALNVPNDSDAVTVLGEPVLLRLLIRNLVDNALRYSTVGGRVAVDVEIDGADVKLHISDNGPGISPAQRRRLCEPFQRGRHDESGTGLGLAIARRVAASHGTRLQMRDGPDGRGLTVTVALSTV
jgi:two-component system sensor histidine kinase QseC